MSEKQTVSHHPDLKNIMGGTGCETSKEKRCQACCGKFYNIPSFKPSGKICNFVTSQGCRIHNQSQQPTICKEYHCNRLLQVITNPLFPEEIRKTVVLIAFCLIDQACEMETIDLQEANQAKQIIRLNLESRPSYSLAINEE